MKRSFLLLFILCLSIGIGLPLQAEENSDGLITGDFPEKEKKEHNQMFNNDAELQTSIQLKDSTKFNTDKTPKDSIRFLKKDIEKPQELENIQDKTKIKVIGNQLYIEYLPVDDILEIYNIMGVKVYNHRVKAGTNHIVLPLSKGYYIIKIGKLTRKVAIK